MKNILTSIFFAFIIYSGHGTTANFKVSQAIDAIETVNISGSKQIIHIKGNSDKNPILLYLNGGPGDSVTDQMDNMFGELQKNILNSYMHLLQPTLW
ncbi:MAG: hypothetical protein AAFO07_14505 [Bacteroidota bacterium]